MQLYNYGYIFEISFMKKRKSTALKKTAPINVRLTMDKIIEKIFLIKRDELLARYFCSKFKCSVIKRNIFCCNYALEIKMLKNAEKFE